MSKSNPIEKKLSVNTTQHLLDILKNRFHNNLHRHKGIEWAKVQERLEANEEKLWSLNEMEKTGGEPDVTAYNSSTNEYVFTDCAAESPKERRSLCYDREGLEARKEHQPLHTAVDMANEMGIELLDEADYRKLQLLEKFDAKTSSWLKTPAEIRKLGGAIFGDYRYGTVFIYHNGAQSYYAGRGFRAALSV